MHMHRASSIGYWRAGAYAVVGLAFVCGCARRPLYRDTQVMLGTFVEVVSPSREAAGVVFPEMKRIERLLSKYDPDSEVSRLNKEGFLEASPETVFILKKAKEFCEASGGAFDVTVAPLLDLWGFTDRRFRRPNQKEIDRALALVGSEKIIIDESKNMVKFKVPGMKIDLGGIAKGYALDCAARRLKEKGITDCLINAGGQIYCIGNGKGRPWKIAIKDPRRQGVCGYIEVRNGSVSTSGDYEQYFTEEGRRFSHIFDPRSGYPVETDILSATISAPDGLTADALSTAVFVMGKQKGEVFARGFQGVQAMVIQKTILCVAAGARAGEAAEACQALREAGQRVVAIVGASPGEERAVREAFGSVSDELVVAKDAVAACKGYLVACERSTHTVYPTQMFVFLSKGREKDIEKLIGEYQIEAVIR